jgi:hypothetical protein
MVGDTEWCVMRAAVRDASGYVYGMADANGLEFTVWNAPEWSGFNWFKNETVELWKTAELNEAYLHGWANGLVEWLNVNRPQSIGKYHYTIEEGLN